MYNGTYDDENGIISYKCFGDSVLIEKDDNEAHKTTIKKYSLKDLRNRHEFD
jgi:hypothetical protein